MSQETKINQNFTAKQQAAIKILAAPPYPKLSDAADALGVKPSTVYAWQMDPAFKSAWQEARKATQDEFFEAARSRIIDALPHLIASKLDLALNGNSEHVRHLESSYLVDRVLGKTADVVKQEVTGKDGGPLDIVARFAAAFDTAIPEGRTYADIAANESR